MGGMGTCGGAWDPWGPMGSELFRPHGDPWKPMGGMGTHAPPMGSQLFRVHGVRIIQTPRASVGGHGALGM